MEIPFISFFRVMKAGRKGYSIRFGTDEKRNAGEKLSVKALLKESSTLFDDIRKKLDDFPELRKCISGLLFDGSKIPYSRYNYILDVGIMFGFLKEDS